MDVRIAALEDGEQFRFSQLGSGPDVLLIHGTLVTLDDMALALMEELSAHFRVTAIDRPGHGGSSRGRWHGSLSDQTASLRRAVALLGLGRCLLVGHSAGATVASAFALDYPAEVVGVVSLAPLVAPELRLEQSLFGARGFPIVGDAIAASSILSDAALTPLLWRAMFLPQRMPVSFAEQFPFALAGKPSDLQATGEEANAFMVDLGINLTRYAFCDVPTMVLTGDRDCVVNPAHGRLLAALLPNGSHQSLHGIGHMLHHFAKPAVVEAIKAAAYS
jgi:pimeloyl-ACP methyl ester carboxylesterase